MSTTLPTLVYEELAPTRDYLRQVALVIGKLQQLFLPANPRDWQHGLVVTGQGLATQPFTIKDEQYQAVINVDQGTLELGGTEWRLADYAAAELLNNLQVWLTSRGVTRRIERPELSAQATVFDPAQAMQLVLVLNQLSQQFMKMTAVIVGGVISPLLFYPHHFDLSIVWFPDDGDKQLGLGFSTGDQVVPEPYIYVTAYPEPGGFTALELPPPAHWQHQGFSGAILSYADLAAAQDPERLLRDLWRVTSTALT